jgi:hypothetical protein
VVSNEKRHRASVTRCLMLVVLEVGGGEQGAAQGQGSVPALESPFAYCTRVGTHDRLGSPHGATSAHGRSARPKRLVVR